MRVSRASAIAATVAALLALSGSAVADALTLSKPWTDRLDCAQARGGSGVSTSRFEPREDVIRGPIALVGAQGLPRQSYVPDPGELDGGKLPLAVRAGHVLRLVVAPEHRGRVSLGYSTGTAHPGSDIGRGAIQVSAHPCARNEAPITAWPGVIHVTGPICARLHLYVDGRRRDDVRLPMGRRCNPRR